MPEPATTAPDTAPPVRVHDHSKKSAEVRVKELLVKVRRLKLELAEARRPKPVVPQRPSRETVTQAFAVGRQQFRDFDRALQHVRLSPKVLDFLIAQDDGPRLLYWLAQGSYYTQQIEQRLGIDHDH